MDRAHISRMTKRVIKIRNEEGSYSGGAGWLLAGLECGREPWGAVEEAAKGVDGVDVPFGGGGEVGLDGGEVGQSLQGAPASAGGTLLDPDGADGAVG